MSSPLGRRRGAISIAALPLLLSGCVVGFDPGAQGFVDGRRAGDAGPDAADADDALDGARADGGGDTGPGDAGAPDGAADADAGGDGCSIELCNGVDDDCDGETDERADLLAAGLVGLACGAGDDVCEPGSVECVGGVASCQGVVRRVDERCNGEDDDCDGFVDNGDPGGGAPCGSQVGACRLGRSRCVDGGLVCTGDVRPSDERCDGIDNDCDGEVDEGIEGLGDPCVSPGECGAGTNVCAPQGGGVCCSSDPGCSGEAASPERCNELDDDCDGQTDEGLPCGACQASCGVDEVPDGARLCLVFDAAQGRAPVCPDGWALEEQTVLTGTVTHDYSCASCACQAAGAIGGGVGLECSYDLAVLPFECRQGANAARPRTCEVRTCDDVVVGDAGAWVGTLEATGSGGALVDGTCDVESTGTFQLCCRDDLPEPGPCLAPSCPVPQGAEGLILVGDDEAVAGACGGGGDLGTVFEGVEAEGEGFSCDPCGCEATLAWSWCKEGADPVSCTDTSGTEDGCRVCLAPQPRNEDAGPASATVTVEGAGPPDLQEGECVLQGARTACSLTPGALP